MTKNVGNWRLHAGVVGVAAVLAGLSGTVAAADPLWPTPPGPGYSPSAGSGYSPSTGYGPSAGSGYSPAAAPAQPAAAPVPMTVPTAPTVPTGPVAPAGPGAAAGVAPTPPALVPATTGTLRDYFAAHQVHLEAQRPETLTALKITLPMPPGWTRVPDPNVPDAFAVIADRRTGALYTPNAQVVVYRLVGPFDAPEAITHGFVDCQQLFAWQPTNASLSDFGGFPSSIIEGTYRQNDMTLNTSERHVIVPTDTDSYLVTLTVTTGAGQSVGNAPATDAIVNGFRVERPGATPHLPSATPHLPPGMTVPPPAAAPGPPRLPGAPVRVGAG